MITSLRLVMPPKMKNSANTNSRRRAACSGAAVAGPAATGALDFDVTDFSLDDVGAAPPAVHAVRASLSVTCSVRICNAVRGCGNPRVLANAPGCSAARKCRSVQLGSKFVTKD